MTSGPSRAALAAIVMFSFLASSTWSTVEAKERSEKQVGKKYLRGEDARIRRILRAEARKERHSLAPASSALTAVPLEARGGDRVRRIEVKSAAALSAALAHARPGDVIRMADGVYHGNFAATTSGEAGAPIILWGSRDAIIDGGSIHTRYGFHLRGSHWVLAGFTIRNARKGVMTDGAAHNRLAGLEVHQIGEEGVHFRASSSDNRLERSWIHDVGRLTPEFGEGAYVGSASAHWAEHSGGKPDASDRNRIIGNVFGPGLTAEGVDVKEGATGCEVRGNLFLAAGSAADSWVDLKGNRCAVDGNVGTSWSTKGGEAVRVHVLLPGWGVGNVIGPHRAMKEPAADRRQPYRLADGRGAVSLVLPARVLPYSIGELLVRFPGSVERVERDIALLKEHLFVGPGASLIVRGDEIRELRLLSTARSFVSLGAAGAEISIAGSAADRVWIRSWDGEAAAPDRAPEDGRAFIAAFGGRMDLAYVDATDLGFGTGRTSGVAWKGRRGERSHGDVTASRFERNYFGAYTFEAEAMRWTGNVFTENFGYGFDPHDYSDRFVVTGNTAFANGSHGIIFSRGCSGNLIRKNVSHSNRGHGIMIDDGKVADDGDPRHAFAVPSDDNRIEANEVWGNQVGIAFQGGKNNVVHGNKLRRNQYGIRLEGSASGNRVTENEIRGSKVFAIHIYNRSDRNRVIDNRITGGQGGIVVRQSLDNVLERNTITGVEGKGIILGGRIGASTIARNHISGRGTHAIAVTELEEAQPLQFAENRTQWMPRRGLKLAVAVWGVILFLPLTMWVPTRWHLASRTQRGRRWQRLAIGLGLGTLAIAVPAPTDAAPGRSLEVAAGLATTFDDNILRYSSDQILDLDSGQYPYRFGIARVDDWVFHPSLGLTWESRTAAARRRSVRIKAEGDVHRRNGVADFGTLGATWREGFAGDRRLSISYVRSPDTYLRRLYDDDLLALPTSERYRDASVDVNTGAIAWRQPVPRASWVDLGYRYDRRRYPAEFRERDSDTHQTELGLAWERMPRGGRLHGSVGFSKRDARAEDGVPSASGIPDEADLSCRTFELGIAGNLDLARGTDWRLAADGRYEFGRRLFDSTRPADRSHHGRKDRIHGFDLGLRLLAGRHWSVRGFYRHEDNRAHYGAGAPAGSEIGGYRVNQTGLVLEWTGEVWNRTPARGSRP